MHSSPDIFPKPWKIPSLTRMTCLFCYCRWHIGLDFQIELKVKRDLLGESCSMGVVWPVADVYRIQG